MSFLAGFAIGLAAVLTAIAFARQQPVEDHEAWRSRVYTLGGMN